VKSGGAIEPQGTRITFRITDPTDMTRDILKVMSLQVFPSLLPLLLQRVHGGLALP